MNPLANILAQDGEGIGELLYLALFLAVSAILAISNWIKKKAEEKQAAERQRQMEERDITEGAEQEQEEEYTWEPLSRHAQQEEAEPEPEPEDEPEEYYFRPPVPPPMPQGERQQLVEEAADRVAVLKPVEDRQLVHAEVTMPSVTHDDPYALPGTARHRGSQGPMGPSSAMDLSDPDQLRQAIILRELLDSPLAMRQQAAPWEV